MTTFIEMVKRHFPSATDDEAESILWECTAFPCCSIEHTELQLAEMAVKSSSPGHAIYHAHSEMDAVWEATRAKREAQL